MLVFCLVIDGFFVGLILEQDLFSIARFDDLFRCTLDNILGLVRGILFHDVRWYDLVILCLDIASGIFDVLIRRYLGDIIPALCLQDGLDHAAVDLGCGILLFGVIFREFLVAIVDREGGISGLRCHRAFGDLGRLQRLGDFRDFARVRPL